MSSLWVSASSEKSGLLMVMLFVMSVEISIAHQEREADRSSLELLGAWVTYLLVS